MLRRFFLLLALILVVNCTMPVQALRLAAQGCSDEAELVEQELDPASGVTTADTTFTVTWIFRNSGDCTWDRNYRLAFVGGERMDSPRSSRLRTQVKPDQTLELSLDLVAPNETGEYNGRWQLRGPDGDELGPELEVTIQVEATGTTDEVILPEVLVFGGRGGASGDGEILSYCLDGDQVPDTPAWVIDETSLESRYLSIYLCSLPEGTEVTVEVTNPAGDSFRRSYLEDAPVTVVTDEGGSYSGTVLMVELRWPRPAPSGDWEVAVVSDIFNERSTLPVPDVVEPEPLAGVPILEYPQLENWPVSPINPFSAAAGCHYSYTPGQEMTLLGSDFPPNKALHLGIYQERLWEGYLVNSVTVQTDGEGSFSQLYVAPEVGSYSLIAIGQVETEDFEPNGTRYNYSGGEGSGSSCFSVLSRRALEGITDTPLQMVLVKGQPGASDVVVLDIASGEGFYPTSALYSECDAGEPAWWPGEEWVIYQTNCVTEEVTEGVTEETGAWPLQFAGDDYDLYASLVADSDLIVADEALIRLTATPDLDETEPDASVKGLIVYRQTPAGSDLSASGELWLLDANEEAAIPLGLSGRAPAWSPDGSRLAFMSDELGSWQIYVYDLAANDLWRVSEGCETHCRFPAWSPDGTQLIYHASASLEDDRPAGLWIASVEGGTSRLWLSGLYGRPNWSSEGWIAFTGEDGIYRAKPGRRPTPERYLFSEPENNPYWAAVWSR
jgi:hypothetical protein